MTRIAIIDDERTICDELKLLLHEYEIKHKLNFFISVYYNGEDLLMEIENNNCFDLIILDIELNKINGIEVGQYIRNTRNDNLCQIIYISSKTDYALELFQVRPFHFLVKPLEKVSFFSCLDAYIRLFSNTDYYKITSRNTERRIPICRICYFESNGRKIILHLLNEEYMFYGKLSDLLEDKRFKNFLLIHKSFFVNISHVTSYCYDSIVINNKIELPISKANRKEVRRAFLQYNADQFERR